MTLLIVDDSSKMRSMLKELFAANFEHIYECEDGNQALQTYTEHKPDWVFMDIKMKKMNGIQATREIIRVFPAAKVLMLTDYDDEDFVKAAKKNGASYYVLKENLNEIFMIINKK
jgi:two-component system response regulator DegU